jgi:Fe-S cluster assembly protein SufD
MNVSVNESKISLDVARLIERSLTSDDQVRKEAYRTFQRLGLPANKAEEYKDTPIARLLEKNFKLQSAPLPGNVDPLPFYLPLTADIVVFINGFYSKEHSRVATSEISVIPLKEAVEENNPLVLKHLYAYADYKTDSLVAWNTAGWTDGIFLHIKKNHSVDRPVIVYHIQDTNNEEVVTATRNLIVSDPGSKFTLIEKFDSIGQHNHFSNHVTEAIVSENAEVNYYSIQNDDGNRYQYNLTQFHQENNSRVNSFSFSLSGKLIRNNLQLSLDGEGIESHMFGLYLLNNDTLADNHTIVDHKKANSFSNELYKGIMDDNSKGVFNGKIYVRPNAQKTNAFQANRNILLTDKATVNTKPQLEIWADDVKCSHGCTTGQLDEEAVFYLRTRGISKDSARAMMLYAFAGEILDNVSNSELKTYLDQLVSERLHKNF